MNKDLPLSPDCRDGNCHKCDGIAWDEKADDYTHCLHDCDHFGTAPQ
jgi:hypothetical protein